jgi:hypothetical protein
MKNCSVHDQIILVEKRAAPVNAPATRCFGLMKNSAANILVELIGMMLEYLKSPLVAKEEPKGVFASPRQDFRPLG